MTGRMGQGRRRLRIVFVTVEYITEATYDGGLANYLHKTALSLIKAGHEPIIVVASQRDESFIYEGVEIHRVGARLTPLLSLINRGTRRRLANSVAWTAQAWRLSARVRHIQQAKPVSLVQYSSCAGTGLFPLKNIPSVVRISGYLPMYDLAYELDRTLDVRMSEWLETIAYLRADGVFAPSVLNARAVQKVIRREVSVIENPFYLETEDLDERLVPPQLLKRKYLLFYGSIGVLKGAKLIGDIISDLLMANEEVYFAFAGKDLGFKKGSMMEYIREKAGRCADRVIYLGRLPHRELYPIIRDAHAVVLPSRMDNLPNTCLEAMAHRKVVIGTRGTSFEQLLEDRNNGFLCEKDDPSDLRRVVENVLRLSDEERYKIGEKANERILKLRPERTLEQLLSYYEAVIAGFYGRKGQLPR
jgi:glycosyltransferase involved in cell wall biosynthesis